MSIDKWVTSVYWVNVVLVWPQTLLDSRRRVWGSEWHFMSQGMWSVHKIVLHSRLWWNRCRMVHTMVCKCLMEVWSKTVIVLVQNMIIILHSAIWFELLNGGAISPHVTRIVAQDTKLFLRLVNMWQVTNGMDSCLDPSAVAGCLEVWLHFERARVWGLHLV